MVSEKLEKLAGSVESLKGSYLSLKMERDKLLEDVRVLGETKERVRVLEAERELLKDRIGVLIESIDELVLGE